MGFANLTISGRLVAGFGVVLGIGVINTAIALSSVQGSMRAFILVGGAAAIAIGAGALWWLIKSVMLPLR